MFNPCRRATMYPQIKMLRVYCSLWVCGVIPIIKGINSLPTISSEPTALTCKSQRDDSCCNPSLQYQASLQLLPVNSKGMIHVVAPDFNPGAWIGIIQTFHAQWLKIKLQVRLPFEGLCLHLTEVCKIVRKR